MKYSLFLFAFTLLSFTAASQTTITVMDSVVFYNGYAQTLTLPLPPTGVCRHRNDLYARKLTSKELESIGTTLQMTVVVKALCDNYDRIGYVSLALVPTGSTSYQPDGVQRIELGRFMTPFMSKNIQPDTVSFNYRIDHIAALLKDTGQTKKYDFWMELSLFGVPYAAQKEVVGCSDRNDVFSAKLLLMTDKPAPSQHSNILIPLFFQQPFNNYTQGATDTLGLTTKSIRFNVACPLQDAALYLITSNHGANEGGEEYIRRDHFAYFDGILKCQYKPGRRTCEPFRSRNTQSNGIYGKTPKSDADWQSFSNWCPGDVVDVHRIDLETVSAGTHTFLIQVPEAVFEDKQGNFPLSLYLVGKKEE